MTVTEPKPDEIQTRLAELRGRWNGNWTARWPMPARWPIGVITFARTRVGFARRRRWQALCSFPRREKVTVPQTQDGTSEAKTFGGVLLGMAVNAAMRGATDAVTRHGRDLLDRYLAARQDNGDQQPTDYQETSPPGSTR